MSPSELSVPGIAVPTVALFATANIVFWITTYCCLHDRISNLTAVLINCACIFAMFTPMHDSAHSSVWRSNLAINDAIGRICSFYFIAPFAAFRYVHLEHHKHTNDPEKDPDFWSARGIALLRPLQWASQEFHYYVPYLSIISQKPLVERVEVIVTLFASYAFVIHAANTIGWKLVWIWILPLRIAVILLAWMFDYIPHRPHQLTRKQDMYGSTSKIGGFFSVSSPLAPLLSILMINQNYHNIHHLFPTVPFYFYPSIWHKHKDDLIHNGTPVVPFYDASVALLSRTRVNAH